jgi:hypothetical protein
MHKPRKNLTNPTDKARSSLGMVAIRDPKAINSLHLQGDPRKDRVVQIQNGLLIAALLICCMMAQGIMVERPLFLLLRRQMLKINQQRFG